MMMTSFPGIFLDVVDLVFRSVVQLWNPSMESILVLVVDWIFVKRHGQNVRTLLDVVRCLATLAWQ